MKYGYNRGRQQRRSPGEGPGSSAPGIPGPPGPRPPHVRKTEKLPGPVQLVGQMRLHRLPFTVDDAVGTGVPD